MGAKLGPYEILELIGVGGPVLRPGTPRPLGLTTLDAWDVTADGKRFLVAAPKPGKPEPFTVVLNWQAGLKK